MRFDEEAEEVREQLKLAEPNGKFSSLLIQQLTEGSISRSLNVHQIYDSIKELAGVSPYKIGSSKTATKFKRPPLKCLWHKHYVQASFILGNMHLQMKKGDNFQQGFNRAMKASGMKYGDVMSESFFAHLAHEMTIGMYQNRSQTNKLTGEWIVYLPIGHQKFYLTLGVHGQDDLTYANVETCFQEFPEVKVYLDNL